jgi:hypothetical protein
MADTYLSGMHSEEGRRALAEAVLALFREWELDEGEQARLLGVAEVASLWQGAALPNESIVLERTGLLLAIDRTLKQQFAEQPLMQERWVTFPNIWLKGRTPIQTMLEGTEGIRQVYELFEHHPQGGEA